MAEAVQDIKDRILIEDLVGQYVQLKKAGKNYKGLCPFHNEKTPSFVVNPERQIAYCFGCNRGGDIFRFIQEIEGVDFKGSLQLLAEKAGISLASYDNHHASLPSGQREQLLALYEKITIFYQDQLHKTSLGKKALEYLKYRGLNEESITKFRLGYSPDSYEETYRFLLEEGFNKKLLVEGGLALTHETTVDKIYDRFRGRLMFPIMNNSGAVAAFGARALSAEQEPKYLNSPETTFYHKSHTLYGFYQAKQGIKHHQIALIVEGYMDVIAAFQSGIDYVVAACGTALTPQQIRMLKPLNPTLLLAFDNDRAGQEAGQRAFEISQDLDMSVKMLEISGAKDIAELTLEKHQDLTPFLEQAKSYIEYRYQQLFNQTTSLDAGIKRRLIAEMAPLLQRLRSPIEKDEYIRRMAYDLELKERQIYDELKSFRPTQSFQQTTIIQSSSPQGVYLKEPGEVLLGLLIEHPNIISFCKDKINENFFPDNWKNLYKAIIDQYNDSTPALRADLLALLPFELQESAALLSFSVAEKYGEIEESALNQEVTVLMSKLNSLERTHQRKGLLKKLWKYEQEGNVVESRKVLQLLTTLHQS